jgi:two-component system chemotaxis sensor kinase CheA
VDTLKIDELIHLAGELAVVEARMAGMAGSGGPSPLWERNLAQLDRITREIQARSLSLRMMPIRQTFQKMTRLVRDSSKRMGKKVNLILTGEDTELDKMVVEQIGDPLVHMLRNCVDHGLETPEERIAAGKPETGEIHLDAACQGDRIVIRVRDDGRGLDRDRILAKAIEQGLLPAGASPTDPEVYDLVFHAGLSTAPEITEISGRGVGMDVVRRNIESLRGRVEIESRKGQGTEITIHLPLTLAIIDGTLIRAGQSQKFGVWSLES